MSEKYLIVEFSDGEYKIPAHIIADSRAKYYAEYDTGETSGAEYDAAYGKEYECTLNDEYELTDRASGNMDWEDVKDHAVLIKKSDPDPDHGFEWVNAEKRMEML